MAKCFFFPFTCFCIFGTLGILLDMWMMFFIAFMFLCITAAVYKLMFHANCVRIPKLYFTYLHGPETT